MNIDHIVCVIIGSINEKEKGRKDERERNKGKGRTKDLPSQTVLAGAEVSVLLRGSGHDGASEAEDDGDGGEDGGSMHFCGIVKIRLGDLEESVGWKEWSVMKE